MSLSTGLGYRRGTAPLSPSHARSEEPSSIPTARRPTDAPRRRRCPRHARRMGTPTRGHFCVQALRFAATSTLAPVGRRRVVGRGGGSAVQGSHSGPGSPWRPDLLDATRGRRHDDEAAPVWPQQGGGLRCIAEAMPHRVSHLINLDGLPSKRRPPDVADHERSRLLAQELEAWLDHRRVAGRSDRKPGTLDELAARRARMNPRLDRAWLRYIASIGARHDADGWRWKLDPSIASGGRPWRPEWSLLRMRDCRCPSSAPRLECERRVGHQAVGHRCHLLRRVSHAWLIGSFVPSTARLRDPPCAELLAAYFRLSTSSDLALHVRGGDGRRSVLLRSATVAQTVANCALPWSAGVVPRLHRHVARRCSRASVYLGFHGRAYIALPLGCATVWGTASRSLPCSSWGALLLGRHVLVDCTGRAGCRGPLARLMSRSSFPLAPLRPLCLVGCRATYAARLPPRSCVSGSFALPLRPIVVCTLGARLARAVGRPGVLEFRAAASPVRLTRNGPAGDATLRFIVSGTIGAQSPHRPTPNLRFELLARAGRCSTR